MLKEHEHDELRLEVRTRPKDSPWQLAHTVLLNMHFGNEIESTVIPDSWHEHADNVLNGVLYNYHEEDWHYFQHILPTLG